MGFILEALGNLAILKNPDVSEEWRILLWWNESLYFLIYLFYKFGVVLIKFFLPSIHYPHTAESLEGM